MPIDNIGGSDDTVEARIEKRRRLHNRIQWIAIIGGGILGITAVVLIPSTIDDRKRFCLEHGYPEMKIASDGGFSFSHTYYCANNQVAVKIESLGYKD